MIERKYICLRMTLTTSWPGSTTEGMSTLVRPSSIFPGSPPSPLPLFLCQLLEALVLHLHASTRRTRKDLLVFKEE